MWSTHLCLHTCIPHTHTKEGKEEEKKPLHLEELPTQSVSASRGEGLWAWCPPQSCFS